MNRRIVIYLALNFSSLSAFSQHKKIDTWYDSKKQVLKESYYILSSAPAVLDSLYTLYYQNGKVKTKGNYVKNKPHGLWEYYYENGNLRSKGELKNGENDGKWVYYYENGNLNMEGEISKGMKEGEWKFYYENQNIKTEGWYRKDRKEGLWKYYYEEGIIKGQAVFYNDHGKYTEVYPNGGLKSEGEIVRGKSNGLWKYYHENGNIKGEGHEKDGLKEGMWKFYHSNGQLLSEGIYIKGQEDGKWNYYYDNGKLSSEGVQKEGKKDGYWKLYYETGAFKGEGDFVNGDGTYKEYYESGKLKVEGNIKNGKNQGEWKYYYESGVLEGSGYFIDGRGNYTGYYENGKKNMEGPIIDGNKEGIWRLYKEDGSLAGYYKTYYENDVAVFKNIKAVKADTIKKDTVIPSIKPRLKIPKKKSRYFLPKINEFQSLIVSTSPLSPFRNALPISLEYYFQERLGYEITYILYRDPMLQKEINIPLNSLYTKGSSLSFKQKFYQKDQDNGMLYFGHEARFNLFNHYVKIIDSSSMINNQKVLQQNDYSIEYAILVGNRLMRDAQRKGWTLDIFCGLGAGYRYIHNTWKENLPEYNHYFRKVNHGQIYVPVRVGINFGYAFKKGN